MSSERCETVTVIKLCLPPGKSPCYFLMSFWLSDQINMGDPGGEREGEGSLITLESVVTLESVITSPEQ